ncbi:MAG: hypothetical protein AB7P23_11230 [Amphiplicatus sp.]
MRNTAIIDIASDDIDVDTLWVDEMFDRLRAQQEAAASCHYPFTIEEEIAEASAEIARLQKALGGVPDDLADNVRGAENLPILEARRAELEGRR